MAEVALDTYATNASNAAAASPNLVAAVSDGTGNRQIVVLGAGDGTATLVDGTSAHPLNVVEPTLTKGTQGSTGVTTQDLKDAGRTFIAITADSAAGTTASTLATLTINKGGTTSSATNYTVTSGKTLRIQNFSAAIKQTNATMNNTEAYLVATGSGTVATTSPIVDVLNASPPTATTNAVGFSDSPYPDGVELPAGSSVGIAHKEVATTASVTLNINGYEY